LGFSYYSVLAFSISSVPGFSIASCIHTFRCFVSALTVADGCFPGIRDGR
jgi:hypothetical protein